MSRCPVAQYCCPRLSRSACEKIRCRNVQKCKKYLFQTVLLLSLQCTHICLIGPRKYGDFRDLHHPMRDAFSIITWVQKD
jgi:lipoate synthase